MESGKTCLGRPIHLVITLGLMAFAEAAAIAAAILKWQSLTHPVLGIIVSLSLASLLLWFSWQGSNVARWIVVIGGLLDLVDALSELLGLSAAWVDSASHPLAVKIKYVVQVCVCAYIVGWLFTKQARTFFSSNEGQRGESVSST